MLAALAPPRAARAAALVLPPRSTPVIVVGAGIAGLVAAWHMRESGWPVRVLEAAPRAGGRCLTLRAGDAIQETDGPIQRVTWPDAPHLYFNPGPARIAHHHAAILGVCRRLHVPLEPLVNENRAVAIVTEDGPIGMRRAVADLRGVVAELALKALGPALDAPLDGADREALTAMLRGFGALGSDGRYRGSARAGWATPPGSGRAESQAQPPLPLARLLDPLVWRAATFAEGLDYQATMLQPVGGMDRIAGALAGTLGDTLLTGAAVVRIRREGTGARVTWTRGGVAESALAGAVLLALPPPVLASLDSDLGLARRTALAALPMAAAGKLGLYAPERFWEADGHYGGIAWTHEDPAQLWYPSHGFHSAGGVLLGSYALGGGAGARFTARPPAARATAAADAWAALHPGFGDRVAAPISVAWARMPRARGAWAEVPAPALGAAGRLLAAPDPPYVFAGDHLSWLPGWQEGAVLSAWSALEDLARSG